MPRCRILVTAARTIPKGSTLYVGMEPAVSIATRQLKGPRGGDPSGDAGAGHFAARRQHVAVEAQDLDAGRRPLGDFKRLDAGKAPTQTMTLTSAITAHRPSTAPQ